jgi:alkylation response protein AidB-like acyl-CoA dehydrogenase
MATSSPRLDLGTTPEAEEFRRGVLAFLAEALPADWQGIGALDAQARVEFLRTWRETLLDKGYLAVAWPQEYGGAGLSPLEQNVLQEEFVNHGVPVMPLPSDSFGFSLIGPTLLHWGTEEQKQRFLPAIISGEHRWAQGYSEPDAGSDLFNLRTRGVEDGDEWVINGQKIWATSGDQANWIFVLTRTEPDQPKARGLSLILVPIEQEGVEVRPIRSMTGEEEFCEVFFTDARTGLDCTVGPRGAGAKVALTLLGYERGSASGATYASYRIELERLTALIKARGLDQDHTIRQRLAWCWSKVEIVRHLGLNVLQGILTGAAPGPESSILKLYGSEYHARLTELAIDVLGMEATVVEGPPALATLGADPLGASNSPSAWQSIFMTARAATIYGGSSQIQRNTLGERVLGLPREPRPEAKA